MPVGGREHARRLLAAQRAGVDPRLRGVVHQHAGQLELRVPDDLAQRAGADVAGRPLDDPQARRGQLAGSASVLSSRNSLRPAAPISRPIPDCL